MSADGPPRLDARDFRVCAVIPTFDNPLTVARVVASVLSHLDAVLLCDDGSGPQARSVIDELAALGHVRLWRGEHNRGKGFAVQAGLRMAAELGFTHAVQVDADGQHDLDEIPAFIDAARLEPDAVVVGYPVFDESAPALRTRARAISRFWVDLEIGRKRVLDPLIGFRVYPVAPVLALGALGCGMEFDTEVLVRLAWTGTRVVNLPVRVRYLDASEGGVSHFRPFRDNARISWLHTRLVTRSVLRRLSLGTPAR